MKFTELEDAVNLATREWVEWKLGSFKTDLSMERLKRQSKLMNSVGLVAIGLIWGFVIAMMIFLHK